MANRKQKLKLQHAANLTYTPTDLTYDLRTAVANKGPRAYDWKDKPHRLLYDACTHIEFLEQSLRELIDD